MQRIKRKNTEGVTKRLINKIIKMRKRKGKNALHLLHCVRERIEYKKRQKKKKKLR